MPYRPILNMEVSWPTPRGAISNTELQSNTILNHLAWYSLTARFGVFHDLDLQFVRHFMPVSIKFTRLIFCLLCWMFTYKNPTDANSLPIKIKLLQFVVIY